MSKTFHSQFLAKNVAINAFSQVEFWNLTDVKDLTNSKSDYHLDFPSLVLHISLILEWVASLANPGWARRGGCHRNIGCLDDLLAVFLFLIILLVKWIFWI